MQEHPPTIVILATILLPLAIVAVVSFAVSYIFARFGGWSRLAARYPAQRPMPRPRRLMGYGVFRGWIGYNGCIVSSTDMQGLYLSVWPIVLPVFHKPIFIPWREIREIKERRRLFGRGFEIHTLRAPEVDFLLRPQTFNFIRETARAAGVPGVY